MLLGNESGVTGGSGKVVKSGPNDNIFIYYADHGAPGLLGFLRLMKLPSIHISII